MGIQVPMWIVIMAPLACFVLGAIFMAWWIRGEDELDREGDEAGEDPIGDDGKPLWQGGLPGMRTWRPRGKR